MNNLRMRLCRFYWINKHFDLLVPLGNESFENEPLVRTRAKELTPALSNCLDFFDFLITKRPYCEKSFEVYIMLRNNKDL